MSKAKTQLTPEPVYNCALAIIGVFGVQEKRADPDSVSFLFLPVFDHFFRCWLAL